MSKPGFHHQTGTRTAANLRLAVRHPALRWHEHGAGLGTERRNLHADENRKGASHRKTRLKVEKLSAGAETLVVVRKLS